MDAARTNDRRTLRLLLGAGVLVGLVVLLVVGLATGSVLIGAVGALVVAVAVAVGLSAAAAPVVRSAVGATPLGAPSARLHNLLDGLAAGAGVSLPDLAATDVAGAHALVVGERAGASTLVVTPGLVEGLDRVELESVLARQLGLVRDRSARLHTVAAVTVGLPALAADLAAADRRPEGPARLVAAAGVVLRPLAGPSRRAVLALQGDEGSFEADRAATSITRYPPGLADALAKLARHPAPPLPVLGPAWTDGPGPGSTDPDDRRLSDRIEALREL